MNRPKLEDYKVFNKEGLITPRLVEYTTDLEKYCDELEKSMKDFATIIIDYPYDEILIEVVCRKLYKYGFIKKEQDEWVIGDDW